MKKLILTAIGLVAVTTLVHAQGFIAFYGSAAGITTNGAIYSTGLSNAPAGKTFGTVANQYDYQLLFATSTTAGDSSPLGADWQLVTLNGGGQLLGNNFASNPGAMTGPGTSGGVGVNLNGGTTYFAMLVGWSAGLGANWGAVSTLLAQGFAGQANPQLFFGNTGISTITPFTAIGAGDPLVFPTVFSNGSLTLFSAQAVPEPTTLALAGLGGLSVLFLRRRKA
jgi:hypothetical protein